MTKAMFYIYLVWCSPEYKEFGGCIMMPINTKAFSTRYECWDEAIQWVEKTRANGFRCIEEQRLTD